MEGTQEQGERPADEQAAAPSEAQDLRRLAGESLRIRREENQVAQEKGRVGAEAEGRADLLRILNKAGITTGPEEVTTGPDGKPTATVDGLEFRLTWRYSRAILQVKGEDCKACGQQTWKDIQGLIDLGEAIESILTGEAFYHKCEPVAPPDPPEAWDALDAALVEVGLAANVDAALDILDRAQRRLRSAPEPKPYEPTKAEQTLLRAIGDVVDERVIWLREAE